MKSVSLKQEKESTFFKSYIAGGVSAVFYKTSTAPIERVTLLLQNQDSSLQITKKNRYLNSRDCVKRVVREQGFFSLWRGYSVTIVRYFNSQSFIFAMNNQYKKLNIYDKRKDPVKFAAANILSGSAAGLTSSLLFYPLDFSRTRLAVDIGRNKKERQFQNIYDVASKIMRSDGLTGFYRGLSITLLLTVLYRGSYFGLYDTGKAYLFKDHNKQNFLGLWFLGTLTTCFSNFVFYPLDTVKKRLQMQSGRLNKQYLSTTDCIKTIYQIEGIRGFFKGVVPNVTKGFGGALVLVLNDKIKKLLQ
ncbi:unnamed protein product [Moneuplotes crassus]|uniref:ADP/ATP translocase n=1 Tax=Euplotes crassus TaxID=5936 RepID=A0AAD1XMI9_EUPCR|nr:unnamed protein product [Moneuplotes crassus]